MLKEITIGNVTAKPGEKKSGYLPVGTRPTSEYRIPFTIINGSKDGPVLALIAGQHGTEYVGITTPVEVIRRTNPKDVSGALLVVPVVNALGFEQRTRVAFPHEDDLSGTRNINRIWPGTMNGSLAHQSIYHLYNEIIKKANYLLDFHGGDLFEYITPCTSIAKVGNEKVDQMSKDLAEVIGFEYLVESAAERSRAKSEAPLIGIPAVSVEIGHEGKLDLKLMEKAIVGVLNVMKYLKMIPGSAAPNKNYRIVKDMIKLRAKHGGLFKQLIPTGNMVKKGEKIGEILSIDGSAIEVLATESGLIIESCCNPAVSSGDIVAEIGILK